MIAWLVGKGLSQRAAQFVAVGAAIVVLLAVVVPGVLLWDHFDDREAINNDRIKREAVETQQALERERSANASAQDRRQAREDASDATKAKLEEIENDDPDKARAPAERGSRAVADRLRGNGGG